MAATLCIFFLSCSISYAQLKKNPTAWPYGGTPDSSKVEPGTKEIPLDFNKPVVFDNMSFDKIAVFDEARFYVAANFRSTIFYVTAFFISARFDSLANFIHAKFISSAVFHDAKFYDKVEFDDSIFNSEANFNYAKFYNGAEFSDVKFDSLSLFMNTRFYKEAEFNNVVFNDATVFIFTRFDSLADFSDTEFYNMITFGYSTFDGLADFRFAEFNGEISFTGTTFNGRLDLSSTSFNSGLDIRRTSLGGVNTIFIDHRTEFPIGDLRLYWDQFKARDSLRLRLSPSEVENSRLNKEHFQKVETFYHRLRDNFTAQGDLASADAVMYELGWQKQEIYGFFSWEGFKQTLYGWFFGWGYRPWKFLAFVIVPVIVGFAGLWYGKFYTVLENAIYHNELELATERIGSQEGSFFLKVWHSVLFSASALLGLRFQKAWILKHKSFLFWVTLEWVVGIGLFVLFALLVKSNQFEYIKGLLGF